ncbi:FecR family protein [Massilia sp. W12]|uniref:FecR family protein n=1 Tax=Massilia sp. W12 TaxID=3126507 RepID=UPI0030D1B064
MTRYLLSAACLLWLAVNAYAGEAGRIVYVSGQAKLAQHTLSQGDPVHEGDEIATGADGFVYVKTVDNGFLILRPSSRARIVAYHIDQNNPKNTRIKLELLSGVARSISGEAVKLARQNFRFNTPVAAIGVRGTDFTVFTDAETSRVAVISGGIVVSGFGSGCGPEGHGPCEGGNSRELFANQVGQMLQIKRGQSAPQSLPNAAAPEFSAVLPRQDEGNKPTAPGGADLSLDPQKSLNLQKAGPPQPVDKPGSGASVSPPLVDIVPKPDMELAVMNPQPPATQPIHYKDVVWGRWQPVLDKPAEQNYVNLQKNRQVVASNPYYVLALAREGVDWSLPQQGKFGMTLQDSEALVKTPATGSVVLAKVENGVLNLDFGKRTFFTSFVLQHGEKSYSLQSEGYLTKDARIYSERQSFISTNTMQVEGIVGAGGDKAWYLFQGPLDSLSREVVYGKTAWGKSVGK